MPKNLTATDRKSLIRLASSMEKGSEQRRAILAGLSKVASDDAWSAPGKKRGWAVVFGTENGGRDYWLQAGEGEPGVEPRESTTHREFTRRFQCCFYRIRSLVAVAFLSLPTGTNPRRIPHA